MNKEALITKILNLSSISFKRDVLEPLSVEELEELYTANKSLKYYDGIKKQQMINTILNFLENKYTRVQLCAMSYMEIEEMFIQTIGMTPKQFEDYLDGVIECLTDRSRLEDNEDFQEFDRDEQIIASGALVINPELLLNRIEYENIRNKTSLSNFDEEYENKKSSIECRINQIDEKLEALQRSLAEDQEAILTCRSQEKHELSNDIRATMVEINMLNEERRQLVDSLSEYYPRAR